MDIIGGYYDMIGAFAAAATNKAVPATIVATTVATETWTNTDGSAWPSQWTIAAGTETIQSNRGQMAPAVGKYKNARADLLGTSTLGSSELLVTVQLNATSGATANLNLNGDGGGTGSNPNNGYMMQVIFNGTGSSVQLYKASGGAQGSNLIGANSRTFNAASDYGMRFRRYGSILYGRVWDITQSEPVAWDFSYTDNGTLLTGSASLGASSGNNTSAQILSYTNLTVSSLT